MDQKDWIILAFGLLFAALGFLIKSKVSSNDSKFKDLYSKFNDLDTRANRRAEAFNNVVTTLDKDLRGLIKSDDEILAIVNGKYQSRRETDLIIKERDEWRANIKEHIRLLESDLKERVGKTDSEILRLRDKYDDLNNKIQIIDGKRYINKS